MGYAMLPGFDASVVGIGGHMRGQRLGRIGEEGFDLGQHRRTVGPERKRVIPAALGYHLRRHGLGVDRITRHQCPARAPAWPEARGRR